MSQSNSLNNILGSLIAVTALAATAQISIALPEELAVAPITGQSLAVLIIARLLPWNYSAAAIIFYLLLGSLGLPVFSDFSSGTEALLGKSMGYFIGFVVAAIFIGKMAEKRAKRFKNYLVEFLIGTLLILIVGGLFLLRFISIQDAYLKGIHPFLIGGLIKVLIGAMLLAFYHRVQGLLNKFPG